MTDLTHQDINIFSKDDLDNDFYIYFKAGNKLGVIKNICTRLYNHKDNIIKTEMTLYKFIKILTDYPKTTIRNHIKVLIDDGFMEPIPGKRRGMHYLVNSEYSNKCKSYPKGMGKLIKKPERDLDIMNRIKEINELIPKQIHKKVNVETESREMRELRNKVKCLEERLAYIEANIPGAKEVKIKLATVDGELIN